MTRRTYAIAGVDRAVAVLRAVADGGAPTLAEVARRAGLDEATALRYLSSLASHELIERDAAAGRYALGLGLFRLGQRAVGSRDVRALARPHMERLLARFEETVNVGHGRQGGLVVIDVLESTRSIRRGATVGESDVWHASALGKAILSRLPEADAVAILDERDRERLTDRTVVALDALVADLRATRARGWAVDDEEAEIGLRCVGAAIVDRHGHPAYALSISGPAARLEPPVVAAMGEALAEAAAAVSAGLGWTDEDPQ